MSALVRALELVQAPAEEPVSVDDARNHARVDLTDDDAWIERAIKAARKWSEARCGRAFVTQRWRLWLNRFPLVGDDDYGEAIPLPKPPLQTVLSVKWVDTAGDLQTLDSADYVVESRREPGLVVPGYGKRWPSVRETPGAIDAVQIEYVAGYGAASDVDERAKQAILMIVAHWYRNRETVAIGAVSQEIELAASRLLYQLWDGVLG